MNPLEVVRGQKEKMMVEEWLKGKGEENHEIECQATIVLDEVSEDVYNRLLVEVLEEMKWL